MKSMAIRLLAVAVVLTLALSAYAGDKGSVKVDIGETAAVNGTQLEPGKYKVEWKESGSGLEVSFIRDGKTVATSQAKLVENGHKNRYDTVLRSPNGDGTSSVTEIRPKGKNYAIVLSGSQSEAGN